MSKSKVTKNADGSATVRMPKSVNLSSLPRVTTRVRMRGKYSSSKKGGKK